MLLHKRTNILGILGVFVTLLLIILFSSSNIRDQARVISSFAQAQCSKECNVDDKNSCGSPFVCKQKCTGHICSLKAGTCEFPECPDGQKCGCTRPTIPPWKGHENYPAPGYAKMQVKVNFKSTYYNPNYHVVIYLRQEVKSAEGKTVMAEIHKLLPLKKGENIAEFFSIPSRKTTVILGTVLRDKEYDAIEFLNDQGIKLSIGNRNCKPRDKDNDQCSIELAHGGSEIIDFNFEVIAKPQEQVDIRSNAVTALRNHTTPHFIKAFICDLVADTKCKNPTPLFLEAQSVDKGRTYSKQKVKPGPKKLYFDTTTLYNSNQNPIRPIDIGNLGHYFNENLVNHIDWRNPYFFSVPAFNSTSIPDILVNLIEANVASVQLNIDKIMIDFSGKPQGESYIKLTPCGFESNAATIICFENETLLKRVTRDIELIEVTDYKNRNIAWKINEELYDVNGNPTGEKFKHISISSDCIRINDIEKNMCVIDHTSYGDFRFFLMFENNYDVNKNLASHNIKVASYQKETTEFLRESYGSAYVKVHICNSQNECDNIYPKLLKLVNGAFGNGDSLDLLGIEFKSGQYVKLDDFLYNEAGQVTGSIPNILSIETRCYDNNSEVPAIEKNTCKYSGANKRFYDTDFIFSLKPKEPARIKYNFSVKKEQGVNIGTIEREICASASGYLCRKLRPEDYIFHWQGTNLDDYNEQISLVQHEDFIQPSKTVPFWRDTPYFLKLRVLSSGKTYEKMFTIEYGSSLDLILDIRTHPPTQPVIKGTNRKIKVLLHNYQLRPLGINTFEAIGKGVDYAKSLAQQVVSALNVANNPVNFEIVEYVELNEFPTFTKNNNLELVNALFSQCALGFGKREKCEQIPIQLGNVDYIELNKDMNLCEDANNGAFDELWHVNMPYTPVGENDIFGPYPININGITTKISACNKNVPTLGIDILSPVHQAMHSFGHRAESLKFVFDDAGDWASPPKTIFEEFILTDNTVNKAGKSHSYSGCGNIHFPPNVTQANLDWYQKTESICDDFTTFDPPRVPLARKPHLIDCFEWGCTAEGYYKWWLMHLPTAEGKDEKGRMNNWWQYVIYTENLVKDSVIAKLMVLDQNKNGIFDQNDYDTFVGQTKTVPLKNQNTILDQNNDQKLTTTDFGFYKNKIGTVLPEDPWKNHSHDHIYKFPR